MIKFSKMFLNKNSSSNNINKSNSSSTNFRKKNYTKSNQLPNKYKCNLFKLQRNIFNGILSPSSLYNFENCPTKKFKNKICLENKKGKGINENQNKNQISRNCNLILKKDKKEEIEKLFKIDKKELLIYEIKYFSENTFFIYDKEHQNDNNSNYPYTNENFLDILLLSHRKKLILNSTIKPLKTIQTNITFQKRNILVSWLTEINLKYVKEQNLLFLSVKYLDRILYKQKIDINDFQLIGLLCVNLALKLDKTYFCFLDKEIISLTGNNEICQNNNKEYLKTIRKINETEIMLCEILDFDLMESTSVLILTRLIQIINIQNKDILKIFISIAHFFLELSLYDEQYYTFTEFVKALSCVILTKSLLNEFKIKLGFNPFLRNCVNIYNDQIRNYYSLCQKTVKELKHLRYGHIFFTKYQKAIPHNVIDNYLREFINNCCK